MRPRLAVTTSAALLFMMVLSFYGHRRLMAGLETIKQEIPSHPIGQAMYNNGEKINQTSRPTSKSIYHEDTIDYPDDGFPKGVLSNTPITKLRSLQQNVDDMNHTKRCRRYGFVYNSSSPKRRRIFYGASIADEPWELFEIVAAESYGIFEGMVFIESNRTQSFTPRPFRRLHHATVLRRLFGANQVQVRAFVNEDDQLRDLDRENTQRYEILRGWKEMGMTPEDVGYIADPDESFSRDFLRAVQVCDGIDAFEYEKHHCGGGKVKLIAAMRVFEMSPECATQNMVVHHPDMILGACIEMIGNETLNPVATRESAGGDRVKGFGCDGWINETATDKYPLWNPLDFRKTCGGYQVWLDGGESNTTLYDIFTAYHFHNFFADFVAIRNKHLTYGHPVPDALDIPLEELNGNIMIGVSCLKNRSDVPGSRKSDPGGFEALRRPLPLYFLDKEYRQRRHKLLQERVQDDEKRLAAVPKKRRTRRAFPIAYTNVNEGAMPSSRNGSFHHEASMEYPDDGFPKGFPIRKLRSLQGKVDDMNHTNRCMRYGFVYNSSSPKRRRIFYGASSITDKPWELFEIVAAESYGIFEGMVFVESNRTQSFAPRRFRRLHHATGFRRLFGANQVQVRAFANEDDQLQNRSLENTQRYEILRGWKEMGMTPDDVGYVADLNESFSRDFLRGVQVCDGIDSSTRSATGWVARSN